MEEKRRIKVAKMPTHHKFGTARGKRAQFGKMILNGGWKERAQQKKESGRKRMKMGKRYL